MTLAGDPNDPKSVTDPSYPPWIFTDAERKRWDLAHACAVRFFGTSVLDPAVRFYASLLYDMPFPTEAAPAMPLARAA